jgi:hypothetical protein
LWIDYWHISNLILKLCIFSHFCTVKPDKTGPWVNRNPVHSDLKSPVFSLYDHCQHMHCFREGFPHVGYFKSVPKKKKPLISYTGYFILIKLSLFRCWFHVCLTFNEHLYINHMSYQFTNYCYNLSP